MRRKTLRGAWLLLLICGLLVSAVAVGCAKKEGAPGGQQAVKEIVIGYNAPLSGPAAEYGRDVTNGVEMAINEINEAGGITVGNQKYKFRLEKLDHRADPNQAVANARRLREQFNARIIFDPVFTCIAPQLKINEEKGNEFLMMAYTSTPLVDKTGNKLMVSITPPFLGYLYGFVDAAWEEGWRKIGMVVTAGAYGEEWRKLFKEAWEKKGGTITADQPANYYTQTDFSAQLTAVLATKPDALLIGGPSGPTALVIEQARNLGFKGGFILVDQAKMDYIIDVSLKGKMDLMGTTVGVGPFTNYPSEGAQSFVKKYREKYNVYPTWEAALNYTAMHALAKAMVKAGTVEDVYAIRAAFEQVLPMERNKYPTDCVGILKAGRMFIPNTVGIIRNGQYTSPRTLVWWAKTEDEFKKFKEMMNAPDLAKWFPIKEYLE
ncbi:ABC transporter substrate-binding protein [Desulfovirgula thermocuniculi]|uniref:ABC transporter substrate-binding protein n=1 Tax=Desulfovirgula thermocuniculi TaxID=348842 RepID=UPI00041CD518|nr:ABC transporter substrate-binding protein [Desulfovirgula thermocuniculi]